MNVNGKTLKGKELFKYLKTHKSDLIDLKKSVVKFSDSFGSNEFEKKTVKAINTNFSDDIESGVIKRTIIGNTYNWLDSHGDVHIDGLFNKSIQENHDRIKHLHDHEYKLTAKIGNPVSISEKTIAWSDLGVTKQGNTMALFMDSNISKDMNSQIFKQYLNGEIDQHSVGMQYVKIDLAINDSDEEEEYKVWNKYIDTIGNRAKAEENGYFWAVKEAKLIEISAVLEGSNELTPTIENKDIEPSDDTQDKNNEPSNDTHEEQRKQFYLNLINKNN